MPVGLLLALGSGRGDVTRELRKGKLRELRRWWLVPSVAWTSRTVSAIVGIKRAWNWKDSCHPHADGELEVSVDIDHREAATVPIGSL